jgi:replication factor A1
MEIKDIKANAGNIDIVAYISKKDEARTFEKFGKEGRVCNAFLKDDTGEVKLTLWNDDVDSVNIGDKVHLQNGWCSEYKGEKQLSSGKFGKIEVLEKSGPEVLTNDPGMLASNPVADIAEKMESENQVLSEDPELKRVEEEEFVE